MIFRILWIAAGLCCLVLLIATPVNKYEWMYEEGVSILPEDGNKNIYRFISLVPVLLFMIFIFFVKNQKEKKILWCVFAALVLFWVFRFWF